MLLKSKEKLRQKTKVNRSWPKRRSRFDASYSLDALMYRVETQKNGLVKHLIYVASSQLAFVASCEIYHANVYPWRTNRERRQCQTSCFQNSMGLQLVLDHGSQRAKATLRSM